jgi:hypothetical protein
VIAWLNPGRWLLVGIVIAALVVGLPLAKRAYDEGKREEGRQQVLEETRLAVEAQAARNREMQRATELRYTVHQQVREEYFVTTIREVIHEAEPLAACRVPTAVRVRLNEARACALADPAAPCGAGERVPGAGAAGR